MHVVVPLFGVVFRWRKKDFKGLFWIGLDWIGLDWAREGDCFMHFST